MMVTVPNVISLLMLIYVKCTPISMLSIKDIMHRDKKSQITIGNSKFVKRTDSYTDKKENKFFSYIRKFRMEHIWGNVCAFPLILGSPSSYMTLQLLHSEFLYIWENFFIIFYQCSLWTLAPSLGGPHPGGLPGDGQLQLGYRQGEHVQV
jgi:hypothetical protein